MKRKSKLSHLFLLLLYLVGVFSACQEPVEGCLDIEATNFDPTADRSCCCTYPVMQLSYAYRAGEVSFNLNTPYEYRPGDTVVFRRAAFYISELVLKRGAEVFAPFDSIWLYRARNADLDSSLWLGNLALINRSAFSSNMGRFREIGTFDGFRMRLGLDDTLNQLDPEIQPRRSRMAIQADSMHQFDNNGYLFLKFELYLPALDKDIEVSIDRRDPLVQIERDLNIVGRLGQNTRIVMTIDYLEWLKGIDLQQDSEDIIRTKLLENTQGALEFSL